MTTQIIFQSNSRLHSAISAARIERNPSTMSEIYDALNFRHYARHAELTPDEKETLWQAYIKTPAGH